jgi:hypothetical protein
MALDTHRLGLTSVFHHISETGAMRASFTRVVPKSPVCGTSVVGTPDAGVIWMG